MINSTNTKQKIKQLQSLPLRKRDILPKINKRWSLSRIFQHYQKRDKIKGDIILLSEILHFASQKNVFFNKSQIEYVFRNKFEEKTHYLVKNYVLNRFSKGSNTITPISNYISLERKKPRKNNTICKQKNVANSREVLN